MAYWSLITEGISLLLIFVLMLNLAYNRRALSPAVRWSWAGLISAAFSIIWNILCVIALNHADRVPNFVLLFMNTVYFMIIVLTCSIVAMFLFMKILEHVYDKFCITRARIILVSMCAVYFAIAVLNVKTGWLFWIDDGGVYHRGCLNWSGYGIMAVQMTLLFICYYKHRTSVSKDMKHVLRIFPPVVLFIVAVQIINPGLLLNGAIVAFVEVILFVGFHSQKWGNDSVTDLGNRDSFFSELTLRTAGNQKFQVILVALTDFGVINCRYGHQIGNEFLYSIAVWIEKNISEASAFRYIGVTYAIMLPYTCGEQALVYEEIIQKRFEQEWKIGKWSEVLPASFCDFIYTDEGMEANRIMEVLDFTLSMVKHSTKKWVRFDDSVADDLKRHREVAELLRNAAEHKWFEVWYQPIYDNERQGFHSAEALVRMRDENGVLVPPSEFIPIAEEIGIVDNIFWFVLEDVCRFLKENERIPFETVSVNMSMPQFENPALAQRIELVLNKYQIPREWIKFEITEREISDDAWAVRKMIRLLVEKGYHFYLDDFGTGYSNFSLVAQFNFEAIKIDKSLVQVMLSDEKSCILVQGLINIFHELGIQVIAEGAETREQVLCLEEQGADKIQGYYYAKPMTEKELKETMEADVGETDGC